MLFYEVLHLDAWAWEGRKMSETPSLFFFSLFVTILWRQLLDGLDFYRNFIFIHHSQLFSFSLFYFCPLIFNNDIKSSFFKYILNEFFTRQEHFLYTLGQARDWLQSSYSFRWFVCIKLILITLFTCSLLDFISLAYTHNIFIIISPLVIRDFTLFFNVFQQLSSTVYRSRRSEHSKLSVRTSIKNVNK